MKQLKGEMTIERLRENGNFTYKGISAEELMALLSGGPHKKAVEELRAELPRVRGVSTSMEYITDKIPRILPAVRLTERNQRLSVSQYSGIILLDIQNVFSDEERRQVKTAVRTLPMTLAAFVGSSGMSMKVLVRVQPTDGVWPTKAGAARQFYQTAHRQMRALYTTMLQKRITPYRNQELTDGFCLSLDAEPLFCPDATPAKVDASLDVPMPPAAEMDYTLQELLLPVPADASHRDYYDRLFDHLVEAVREEFISQGRHAALEENAFMERVVELAAERKVEEAEVRARLMQVFGSDDFATARKYVRAIYDRQRPLPDSGNKTADTINGLQEVLKRNYDLEKNMLNGALYVRERTTYGQWRRLLPEDINTMTLEVQEAGVNANTHHVQTYLNSRRIPQVNPVQQLLEQVQGKWDGKDHIEALARRVPTKNRLWPKLFHVWFCAMVQQWMGGNGGHGNELVPVLIGPQGVGKSSFCRKLLPPQLFDGYLDHIDFRNERESLRAMSTFQLINIDEFNRYSAHDQEGDLKYFIQLSDIRLRRNYSSQFDILPRMASFIATCNPSEVLVDATGSRRYICVRVQGLIDLLTPFNYFQLYAQAVDELGQRRKKGKRAKANTVAGRTYLTKDEETAMQEANREFSVHSVAVERFRTCFEPQPQRLGRMKAEGHAELNLDEIFQQLDRMGRKPLGEGERGRLQGELQHLSQAGKLAYYRKNRGYVYHVKYMKEA